MLAGITKGVDNDFAQFGSSDSIMQSFALSVDSMWVGGHTFHQKRRNRTASIGCISHDMIGQSAME